ncbi:hypothetical protein SESBI_42352 [Sesbania bispinosa]|nr:hypothetical protein SESBI_42352 [Sesbania bispinosa]
MSTDQSSPHQNNEARSQSTPIEEAPPIIIYEDEDVTEGLSTCLESLVGRILTEKPIHVNSIQSALTGIWCNPSRFRVEELAPKTFQFFFEDERESTRILNNSPWLFRNSWLVLKKWERGADINTMNFRTVEVKMQIWGLPPIVVHLRWGGKLEHAWGQF